LNGDNRNGRARQQSERSGRSRFHALPPDFPCRTDG
jgi:hypothetical protein